MREQTTTLMGIIRLNLQIKRKQGDGRNEADKRWIWPIQTKIAHLQVGVASYQMVRLVKSNCLYLHAEDTLEHYRQQQEAYYEFVVGNELLSEPTRICSHLVLLPLFLSSCDGNLCQQHTVALRGSRLAQDLLSL